MMNVQRFDFANLRDFRNPPEPVEQVEVIEEPEVAAPPPPPTFSEAELEAAKSLAKEEGRQQGFDEGIEKANTEAAKRDKKIEAALQIVVQQVGMIETRHNELMKKQCEELAQLVWIIAHKLVGDALSAAPEAAVKELINACLTVLLHKPKVLLTVHPSIKDTVHEYIEKLISQTGSECHVKVAEDESMNPSEGKLEWKDGFAERDLAAIWSQIQTMLEAVDFTALVDAPKTTTRQDNLTLVAPETMDENANTEQPSTGEQL